MSGKDNSQLWHFKLHDIEQDIFLELLNKRNTEQIVQAKYLAYLKMISAFADMEAAVPHFSSSAASQKAKFSPGKNSHWNKIYIFIAPFSHAWHMNLKSAFIYDLTSI